VYGFAWQGVCRDFWRPWKRLEAGSLGPLPVEHHSTSLHDGQTGTQTGDNTIFSRYLRVAPKREIAGKQAVSGNSVRLLKVRNLHVFPRDSGDEAPARPKCAGSFTR
jgi:hypothetical protein